MIPNKKIRYSIFMTHVTKKVKTIPHIIIEILNTSWTNNKFENELNNGSDI